MCAFIDNSGYYIFRKEKLCFLGLFIPKDIIKDSVLVLLSLLLSNFRRFSLFNFVYQHRFVMAVSDYVFIKTFRTGDSIFELYKNQSGQFKTIKTVQGSYVPEETFYDNSDQLADEFSNEISRKELLG